MKVAVLFSLFSALSFAAHETTYEIKQYPKDSGDCHTVARDLGVKFQQITGAEVSSAVCALITDKGYNLQITYKPIDGMSFVSTYASSSTLDDAGGFKTDAECRQALPAETAHFAQATSLTPVVSYCSFEPYDHDYPWGPRIEAFGDTKVKPYRAGSYVFGQVQGYSLKTFTTAIVENLLKQGIDARWARHRSSIGYGRLSVFYYGENRISFNDVTVVKVAKPEQCNATLGQLSEVLAQYKPLPAVTFCAAQSVGGYYELMTIFPDARSLKFSQAAEGYNTYELCQADRARLINFYKNDLKRPVVAGYCTMGEERSWRVMLLETK